MIKQIVFLILVMSIPLISTATNADAYKNKAQTFNVKADMFGIQGVMNVCAFNEENQKICKTYDLKSDKYRKVKFQMKTDAGFYDSYEIWQVCITMNEYFGGSLFGCDMGRTNEKMTAQDVFIKIQK